MNTILITGGASQLAGALLTTAPPAYACRALARDELDIRDPAAARTIISQMQPAMVINCAAYNLVDEAENEGLVAAFESNAMAPARLAGACREAGLRLLHFSTDFVFDGLQNTPYQESDRSAPVNSYGASKLAGENLVLAASPDNLVIRVSRLFGPRLVGRGGSSGGKPAANFPALMLRLAAQQRSVRVVRDQIGAPTYTMDLARAVWELVGLRATGLFHLTNSGEASFDEMARLVFEVAGVRCGVEPVTSEQFGAPARRPAYSTLASHKAWRHGATPLRHWREAMTHYIVSGEAAG